MMSGAFMVVAVIATVLSALGLYALTAFAAARRTQEVGVRLALGASRTQIRWLFLRRTLLQVSIGLTIGLAGAVAAGALLQGVLVDVRANNPVTLAAVAVAATLVPTRRAARMDPVAALRAD